MSVFYLQIPVHVSLPGISDIVNILYLHKMDHLTETQRIEILMILGYGDRMRTQQEVCNIFNDKYPDRNPLTRSTVSKVFKKFRESGHVKDAAHYGRPKSATDGDKALNVLLSLEENPHLSTRILGEENHISHMSVDRLLKTEKFHPYKIRLVQELSEDDYDRRLQFCEIMMERCNANPDFVPQIVFSDESTFFLNGTVNRHNCRYWARENPHWKRENHTQFPQKVNVWAGIIGRRIIGPFFMEEMLNGERYLQLLRNEIVPALVQLFPNNRKLC